MTSHQIHTRHLALAYRQNSSEFFLALRDLAYPVMLQSGVTGDARFDILSADPAKLITLRDNQHKPQAFLLQQIEDAMQQHTSIEVTQSPEPPEQLAKLPFIAGAIGILDYSVGEQLLDIGNRHSSLQGTNYIGIYQWAVIQDHQREQAWLVADQKLDQEQWLALSKRFTELSASDQPAPFSLLNDWQTTMSEEQYRSAFTRLQRYIHAGDCYQVNLTRHFSAEYKGDPFTAYGALFEATKAPFGGYLETPNNAIVSCSPERFIQIQDGKVLTQPIKGSRPRGRFASEDTRYIAQLSGSAKDRAENLMIVDLMRNDLGKNSINGSIEVPKLFEIKSFANVHHMVSSITGEITANNVNASLRLLLGCMPGGSITGAPKKRAMEIIAELELTSRSIYCGSAFYLNRNGNLDSNIMIRSLLFNKANAHNTGNVHCWGGGGIVADSEVENELQESYYKISNLLEILNAFKRAR